jgi:hypothetical protein
VAQEIGLWVAPIKDAIEELEEVEQVSGNDEDDEGSDDEDGDDGSDGLTERELELRPPVVAIAKIACLALKKASLVVTATSAPISMAQLDEFVRLANRELLDTEKGSQNSKHSQSHAHSDKLVGR